MESVEVWMWVIAGLVLGGIVFIGGFKLLANYVHSTEISVATGNVNLMYGMINNVCFGGRGEREVKSLVFPSLMKNLYIQDEYGVQGQGKHLCYLIEGDDPRCMDLKACGVTMESISLVEEKSIFNTVQKFLGQRKYQRFRFSVHKQDWESIDITWNAELLAN